MTKANKKFDVRKMTYLAIFSALVFVLQIMAIPVGGFFESSALPVAVIVIGAALFGIRGGAWYGVTKYRFYRTKRNADIPRSDRLYYRRIYRKLVAGLGGY